MSVYCIGDLHGRYDLFEKALEAIHFVRGKDKMYLLGDVIDAGDESVRILQTILCTPHSFTLILGNHESNFLRAQFIYDTLLSSRLLRARCERVLQTFSQAEFEPMRSILCMQRPAFRAQASILSHPAVISWLSGSPHRGEMLGAMLDFLAALGWDTEKYAHIYRAIFGAKSYPKIRRFLMELLHTDDTLYRHIKTYLAGCEKELKFSYHGKKFWLRHDNYVENVPEKPSVYPRVFHHIQNPHSIDRYLLFGHDHVGMLQQKADTCLLRSALPFSYGFDGVGIFAYCDTNRNHYYNLDLVESGLVGVLRLDDFAEFYIGQSDAPMPELAPREQAYRDGYRVVARSEDGIHAQMVTYYGTCMEYLVHLDRHDLRLTFLRADKADRSDCRPTVLPLEDPYLSEAQAVQMVRQYQKENASVV